MNSFNTLPGNRGESPTSCDEKSRAQTLAAHGVDALEDDPELAAIVGFVTKLCGVTVATVTVVEEERQWFLAREGIQERETPRSTSFCAHAMLGDQPLIVPDATQDPRFADFSAVTGPMHVRFYAGFPLVAEDGTPIGALCAIDTKPHPGGLDPFQREGMHVMTRAVVRRMHHNRFQKEAKSEAEASEARLRAVIDSVPQIAWSADEDGTFDYFNARWAKLTGAEGPRTALEWKPFLHPDDFDKALQNWTETFSRAEPFEAEYRLRMADGSYRWNLARGRPVTSEPAGRTRWYGTITDIESTHRETEASGLLAGELSHRIKNIFAVVSGLISLTSRDWPDAKGFAEDLSGKVGALGRAHDFVRPAGGDMGNSLHDLLGELLRPYAAADADRVRISGDDAAIRARSATPLALVFHEFATNAAKYGALSVPGGEVAISIATEEDRTIIEWRESGGPPPAEATHSGFGSRLVEMTVTSQLRGELQRELRPTGYFARLSLPRSAL